MKTNPVAPQPPPTGDGTPVLELVLADLRAKSTAGTKKYGGPLRTLNGRLALVDAYQELLDLAMYLRQQLEEDREVAAQARAAALQEAIAVAEAFFHVEPLDQADELDRIATYSNGTLRRLIAQLQALQGALSPGPVPTGPARRRFHQWVGDPADRSGVVRCRNCPLEQREATGVLGGAIVVYERLGVELARGLHGVTPVPPCEPVTENRDG